MKLPSLGLCAVFFGLPLLAPPPACAQQPMLPPDSPNVNAQLLLEALKTIREGREKAEKAVEARLVGEFGNAAASNSAALAFYLRAKEAVDFAGKPASDFRDWKEKNSDDLKSDAVQNAIRMHLRYLLLTLERARGATTAQLEAPLLAYIAELNAIGAKDDDILHRREKLQELKKMGRAPQPIQGQRPVTQEPLFWTQPMIKAGAAQSIFVKHYGVEKIFAKARDWEASPANVEGMYKLTLLPYYRETRNLTKLLGYWDGKLIQEGQDAQKSNLSFKMDAYNQVRRPQLLWSRVQEISELGLKNRAINEMMELIKTYPNHPDQGNWVGTLEKTLLEMLTPAALPAGAAPAATPGAAPAAPAARPATAAPGAGS